MKKEMVNLPKVKKTINAFLVGEEGKISKQSIIKAGVILTAISLGTIKGVMASHSSSTPHQNSLGTLDYQEGGGIGSTNHTHHANHSSSHSSSPSPSPSPSPSHPAPSTPSVPELPARPTHGSHGQW